MKQGFYTPQVQIKLFFFQIVFIKKCYLQIGKYAIKYSIKKKSIIHFLIHIHFNILLLQTRYQLMNHKDSYYLPRYDVHQILHSLQAMV